MPSADDLAIEQYERVLAMQSASKAKEAGRLQSHEAQFAGWDGENCFDCGEPIPPARVALGRVRCISCEEDWEKRNAKVKRR